MFPSRSALSMIFLTCLTATAQQPTRPKDVRELAKGGQAAIPKLQELLSGHETDVRAEAVKQIVDIGSQHSLDPLILATRDNEPEIQIRATDGLVNFYLPGYVKHGLSASVQRVGTTLKGHFTDTNDQVIDSYIKVRPDVIEALGKLARGGGRMDARANAARALGILRGRAAVPDLLDALRSKDTDVIYESLNALQKIHDESAATRLGFLLRDPNQKVQITAIETMGLLQNKAATPELIAVLNKSKDKKVQRAALTAIAMLPDNGNRELYARYMRDKDDRLRAAAAEGYARLNNPSDLPMLEKAWNEEKKTEPRLSVAFAMVMLGRIELSEFSPLQYLVNTLNSASYKGEAFPFLIEAARNPQVRTALYGPLLTGTKEEKIQLAGVMARSGDRSTVPQLEKLSNDTDGDVAKEGLRAMRELQARL
jgi:HEAT repeats/PBS lyase HEAT-like repeat